MIDSKEKEGAHLKIVRAASQQLEITAAEEELLLRSEDGLECETNDESLNKESQSVKDNKNEKESEKSDVIEKRENDISVNKNPSIPQNNNLNDDSKNNNGNPNKPKIISESRIITPYHINNNPKSSNPTPQSCSLPSTSKSSNESKQIINKLDKIVGEFKNLSKQIENIKIEQNKRNQIFENRMNFLENKVQHLAEGLWGEGEWNEDEEETQMMSDAEQAQAIEESKERVPEQPVRERAQQQPMREVQVIENITNSLRNSTADNKTESTSNSDVESVVIKVLDKFGIGKSENHKNEPIASAVQETLKFQLINKDSGTNRNYKLTEEISFEHFYNYS